MIQSHHSRQAKSVPVCDILPTDTESDFTEAEAHRLVGSCFYRIGNSERGRVVDAELIHLYQVRHDAAPDEAMDATHAWHVTVEWDGQSGEAIPLFARREVLRKQDVREQLIRID